MVLSKELLDILACPICKESLIYEKDTLTCQKCQRVYPVVDDIPHLLVEED